MGCLGGELVRAVSDRSMSLWIFPGSKESVEKLKAQQKEIFLDVDWSC